MAWSREEALAMERRHVVEGEQRCIRQRMLIARMLEQKHDTAEAERLLATMQDFLAMSRSHVLRLEQQGIDLPRLDQREGLGPRMQPAFGARLSRPA